MTKTYSIKDSIGRTITEDTNRREAEKWARKAVEQLGGCWVVTVGEQIVTLVERDGKRIDVRRLD